MSVMPTDRGTGTAARARRAGAASLVANQTRYDLRAFRRNTRARIFTLAVPVLLLLILVALFHSGTVKAGGATVKIAAYYVPHIAAMAIVGAGLINLLITLVAKRESGSLKRRRATPVPSWVLIAGDAATSILSSLVIVAVLVAIGSIGYGLAVSGAALGVAAVETVVGAAAFCCMAYALSGVVTNAESAGPVVQLTTLPVYFISGIYVPDDELPHWLLDVANVLPVRPLAVALQAAFVPATNGGQRFALVPVMIVAAWGVAGLLIAVRTFSWMPKRS
ncbi:MAG TPA: ABC transporter permease [Streptosporangiaceae bacterium]|nr:ABC transporter permease [Streptosporangiaceae bacterium]